MKALCSSALLALLLVVSHKAEAKNGFYPTNFSRISPELEMFRPKTGAGKLQYYGGPVIANVKTYAVFWGKNVDAPTKSGIGDFFKTVTNSSYMDLLKQYDTTGKAVDGRDGTNQHIGHGTYAGAYTITPAFTSNTIEDTDIQTELQHQFDTGALPKPDANSLYMVYFPPGATISIDGMQSCSSFCAYHGFKGAPETEHFYYGVMPDLGGACSFGCGFTDHFTNVTAITSHEYMEAITDPFPTPGSTPAYPQAWNSTDGSEIGDLCAGNNNNLVASASKKTYAVQSEYDNSTASCTTKNWTAP